MKWLLKLLSVGWVAEKQEKLKHTKYHLSDKEFPFYPQHKGD